MIADSNHIFAPEEILKFGCFFYHEEHEGHEVFFFFIIFMVIITHPTLRKNNEGLECER